MRRQLETPLVLRGELADGCCRSRISAARPARSASSPAERGRRRSCRSEPLEERGPAEQIEIERIRMSARPSISGGMPVSGSWSQSRASAPAPAVHQPHRVMAGDALLDPRVPPDDNSKERRRTAPRRAIGDGVAPRDRLHTRMPAPTRNVTSRRREIRSDSRASVSRDSSHAGWRSRVGNGCRRHAARSIPAGLRARMFNRQ